MFQIKRLVITDLNFYHPPISGERSCECSSFKNELELKKKMFIMLAFNMLMTIIENRLNMFFQSTFYNSLLNFLGPI